MNHAKRFLVRLCWTVLPAVSLGAHPFSNVGQIARELVRADVQVVG
jgi:hypothetical protein